MNKIFDAFKKCPKADWLAKVNKDLKGRAIEELDWQLTRDLNISPFAHREDLEELFPPLINNRKTNAWEPGVLIIVKDFVIANKEALNLLDQGAVAICFKLRNTPSREELGLLLNDIQLEWISTHFLVQQESWKRLSENFLKIIKDKKQDPKKVNCSFDVVGSPVSDIKEIRHFESIQAQLPKGCFLAVNTCQLFSNKEKVVKALAETIRQGNQILITLNEQGFEINTIYPSIQFSIGLSESYLLNIATIRALKLLWQQILESWDEQIEGVSPIIVHLGTDTQSEDENLNKISATVQAMSAIIGGADRLFIHPSDAFEKEGGSSFSQRIALNIQHLMQLESYMDRVIDPAAGSYYIENLTEQLAEAAWMVFQKK